MTSPRLIAILEFAGIEGRPDGLWAAIESLLEHGDVEKIFDVTCIIAFDALAGRAGRQIGAKSFSSAGAQVSSRAQFLFDNVKLIGEHSQGQPIMDVCPSRYQRAVEVSN